MRAKRKKRLLKNRPFYGFSLLNSGALPLLIADPRIHISRFFIPFHTPLLLQGYASPFPADQRSCMKMHCKKIPRSHARGMNSDLMYEVQHAPGKKHTIADCYLLFYFPNFKPLPG
jgi:hypothetical protein